MFLIDFNLFVYFFADSNFLNNILDVFFILIYRYLLNVNVVEIFLYGLIVFFGVIIHTLYFIFIPYRFLIYKYLFYFYICFITFFIYIWRFFPCHILPYSKRSWYATSKSFIVSILSKLYIPNVWTTSSCITSIK